MKIWIVMVWDCDDWEILDVLFDDDAIAPRVTELFKEAESRTEIKVECWYKDPTNDVNGYFLDVDAYWRDDWLEGE